MIAVPVISGDLLELRRTQILEALEAGFVARFRYPNGVVKHVESWNPDADGDLTAVWSTSKTKAVCWEHIAADVSFLSKELALVERGL